MNLRICPGILLGTLLLTACHPLPKAEHPEKWAEIEAYIQRAWPDYLEQKPGFPAPYVYGLNPGTLYYWDFYFHNEGLMRQGYWEIAKGNLDCMIWQIDTLGFIPTAIRWGADRSQSPFFSPGVRRYYELSPEKDAAWLRIAYAAVLREYAFWTNLDGNDIEDHTSAIPGLQRYGHHADSAALISFYDRVLKGRFHLSGDAPAAEKIAVAGHRLAEAETMDFTPRFEGRCMDYIPVDLNAYLYGYEQDLAFYERELGLSDGKAWEGRAAARAALIEQYLWDEQRGLYLDYDAVNGRHSPVASVATLIPLWTGMAPRDHARRVRDNMPLFDSPGGLVVCELSPQPIVYQWGDGAVWAPIQELALAAMQRYGYHREAKRIALKWLNTVTRNYIDPQPATYPPFKYGDGTRHPGFLYEKYTREGLINDAEYPCSEMLGWTASAFLAALDAVQ